MPVYEYLNMAVQGNDDDSVTMHFGGWLRYDRKEDDRDDRLADDLQYAYANVRDKESRMNLKLGRVMVLEGVASERIDGGSVRFNAGGGVGFSAFGGNSVITSEGNGSNTVYGGRMSYQIDGRASIGASYLKQNSYAGTMPGLDPAREERGIDLWLRPMSKMELLGRSSYNVLTEGWMEHAYYLVLGPFEKFRLNTEATWVNYEEYFASATTRAFLFAPGGKVDPREKLTTLGEEISYPITASVNISADYKRYEYTIAGNAGYYGVKAAFSATGAAGIGGAVHRMSGGTARLRYTEYRIYCYRKLGHLDLTADLFDVKYDEAINGMTNSYAVSAAAGYELTDRLRIGTDVEYAKNPDYDKDVRLLIKLSYRFDAASAPHPRPATAAPAQETAAKLPAIPAATGAAQTLTTGPEGVGTVKAKEATP